MSTGDCPPPPPALWPFPHRVCLHLPQCTFPAWLLSRCTHQPSHTLQPTAQLSAAVHPLQAVREVFSGNTPTVCLSGAGLGHTLLLAATLHLHFFMLVPTCEFSGRGEDARKQVYQGDKWDSSRTELSCLRSLLGLAKVSDRGTGAGR